MKKVLIITYYWPPSAGGGVMRWLKMSKYLPEHGWQPIIYTPENPDSSVDDESLLHEIHQDSIIIKHPIWEPYDVYRRLSGKKKGTKFKAGYVSEASTGNWKSKLSVFIRGNFLIPDPRKFWIKPSIRFLSKYLKENDIDAIVSTGPPHSMHLIALGLKKKFPNIKWIADFRDPWTNIDFYFKLRLTNWADKKHKRLEKEVLIKADHVVTVTPRWQEELANIGNREIDLVYNGFDHIDFENLNPDIDDKFSISHFGSFNKDRNPDALWIALNEMLIEIPELKESLSIQLIGQTDDSITHSIKKAGLDKFLTNIDFLPHNKGVVLLKKSQVLLLPINNAPNALGIIPGKMYEYIALNRPILAIGPTESDSAQIISETNSGICNNFEDVEGIKSTLQLYFNHFKKGTLKTNSKSYEKYSRKNQTANFVKLLNK
ncbi:glycosyltransferase [Draconibacterium mangrovi]|uniref:glycosyltransferase n=1 Tax=Draconibacterium mangrovi TaxID=2697469 RepID=UPI0013D37B69|nr:glycosyltransferase [Draconibacterium mangrovi]